MDWIYLSPHFDDAALSCGGLIWEQAQGGNSVSIWTTCAGRFPPGELSAVARELHARWWASRDDISRSETEEEGRIVELRREEDLRACNLLSAACYHFDIPDCIYRFGKGDDGLPRYYYPKWEAITSQLDPGETPVVTALADRLSSHLPGGAQLVIPLGLGNHVDHQLSRLAAERLQRELWYYADFPYTREQGGVLENLKRAGWKPRRFRISPAGLDAWQRSVAAYRSQISSFWPNLEAMRDELEQYCEKAGGVVLWSPPGKS